MGNLWCSKHQMESLGVLMFWNSTLSTFGCYVYSHLQQVNIIVFVKGAFTNDFTKFCEFPTPPPSSHLCNAEINMLFGYYVYSHLQHVNISHSNGFGTAHSTFGCYVYSRLQLVNLIPAFGVCSTQMLVKIYNSLF